MICCVSTNMREQAQRGRQSAATCECQATVCVCSQCPALLCATARLHLPPRTCQRAATVGDHFGRHVCGGGAGLLCKIGTSAWSTRGGQAHGCNTFLNVRWAHLQCAACSAQCVQPHRCCRGAQHAAAGAPKIPFPHSQRCPQLGGSERGRCPAASAPSPRHQAAGQALRAARGSVQGQGDCAWAGRSGDHPRSAALRTSCPAVSLTTTAPEPHACLGCACAGQQDLQGSGGVAREDGLLSCKGRARHCMVTLEQPRVGTASVLTHSSGPEPRHCGKHPMPSRCCS